MNYLPTKAEICSLPRWAQVALAARCARRFLFRSKSETARQAVGLAEEAAATGEIPRGTEEVSRNAWRQLCSLSEEDDLSFEELSDLGILNRNDEKARKRHIMRYEETQGLSVKAFASATNAIASLGEFPTPFLPEELVFQAAEACSQAAGKESREAVELDIRNDFSRLLEAARREAWTDDTTVPTSFWEDSGGGGG